MRHPATPPDPQKVWEKLQRDPQTLVEIFNYRGGAGIANGAYEHWDKIRFRPPAPPLTPEQTWVAIKVKRRGARRDLPFVDKSGQQFHFVQTGNSQRALHEIDSNARGLIGMPGAAANSETRDIYLQKSLIEEPFSSSVLEGAATTREIARKMIEEGRPAKNTSELMVLNNYRAMSFIREHYQEKLTPAIVLELHRILTAGTLERPEKVGVFRAEDDDVRVVHNITGETLHTPPPAEELPKRIQALCDFANEPQDGIFLHPIIRAIVLHFMLAYDHPFWDGNGRCARALFYWCVLRHGYWLLEYVSISSVIMQAASKYGRAFLFTETDEGDVTYFIEHQLGVIEQSLVQLRDYLIAKGKELNELGRALGGLENTINRRQLALVQHLLKRPSLPVTIAQHRKLNAVSYLTARADLESLVNLRLLIKTKDSTTSIYTAPKDFKDRLRQWRLPASASVRRAI